jgi:hypothetical protein
LVIPFGWLTLLRGRRTGPGINTQEKLAWMPTRFVSYSPSCGSI